MKAPRIAIIIGSTRPGRNGEAVAKWVYEVARFSAIAEGKLPGRLSDGLHFMLFSLSWAWFVVALIAHLLTLPGGRQRSRDLRSSKWM